MSGLSNFYPPPVIQHSAMGNYIGRILVYTFSVFGQFLMSCVFQVVFWALGVSGRMSVFLPAKGVRSQQEAQSSCSLEGDQCLVPFVPPTCEMRSLLTNVSRYSYLKAPKTAVRAKQSVFLEFFWKGIFGNSCRYDLALVQWRTLFEIAESGASNGLRRRENWPGNQCFAGQLLIINLYSIIFNYSVVPV